MTSERIISADDSVRRRELLDEVLLTSGVTFSLAHPDRWARFVRGGDDLELGELELDSLSFNELSVSLELRAGLRVTPAELAAHRTLDELARRFDLPPVSMRQGAYAVPDHSPAPSRTAGRASLVQRAMRLISERMSTLCHDIVGSATPRQLIALAKGPLSRVPALRDTRRFASLLPIADREILRWSARFLARDVLLYERARRRSTTAPVASPAVLVFAGNARRPMMPMALFLTALADITDRVILVRTRRNDAFRSGIHGLGSGMDRSFRDLADMVGRYVVRSTDDRMPVVIGTSGGGLPALIFADYLPVNRVVMVGPNATDDPRWHGSALLEGALDRRERSQNRPRVIVCYGAQSSDTAKVASWRQDLPDAQFLAIPGAPHNALYPLVVRDKLTDLFRAWIA